MMAHVVYHTIAITWSYVPSISVASRTNCDNVMLPLLLQNSFQNSHCTDSSCWSLWYWALRLQNQIQLIFGSSMVMPLLVYVKNGFFFQGKAVKIESFITLVSTLWSPINCEICIETQSNSRFHVNLKCPRSCHQGWMNAENCAQKIGCTCTAQYRKSRPVLQDRNDNVGNNGLYFFSAKREIY